MTTITERVCPTCQGRGTLYEMDDDSRLCVICGRAMTRNTIPLWVTDGSHRVIGQAHSSCKPTWPRLAARDISREVAEFHAWLWEQPYSTKDAAESVAHNMASCSKSEPLEALDDHTLQFYLQHCPDLEALRSAYAKLVQLFRAFCAERDGTKEDSNDA